MRNFYAIAALMLFATFMQAEDTMPETNARIEINGGQKVQLKAVSGPEDGYLKNFSRGKEKIEDGIDFNLIGETAALPADQWVKASFVFLPQNDGKVTIYLKGNWGKSKGKTNLDVHWVYYDRVTVEGGGPLQNGDFEEAVDGKPVGWNCTKNLIYITSGMKAFSGNAMVKTWHNQYCSQTFDVRKDQQVTVTVNVKMGDIVLAKD
jgi:hypothetical protein